MPAPELRIRELGFALPFDVRLRGRTLPFRSFPLDGEMVASFTHYPGNPSRTVQLLGSVENGTTLEGAWHDRHIFGAALVNGEAVNTALDLAAIFDQIRRRGQEIEVTWSRIVRRGILTHFRQDYEREEDLNWEMVFEWISQGDATPPGRSSDSFSAEKLVQALDPLPLEEALDKLGSDKAPSVFETARTQLDSLREVHDKIVDTVSGTIDTVLQPVTQASALLSLTNAFSSIAVDAADSLLGQLSTDLAILESNVLPDYSVDESILFGAANSQFVYVPGAGTLSLYGFEARTLRLTSASAEGRRIDTMRRVSDLRRELLTQAAAAALQGRELERRLRRRGLLGIHIGRAGDDLRDVALLHYGEQAEWRRLKDYNHLDDSKLEVGQVVLVPRISGGLAA